MAGDKWQDVRRDVRRLADRSIFGLAINRGKDRRDLSIFHDRFNLVRRFCHSFVMHRDNPSIDSLLDSFCSPLPSLVYYPSLFYRSSFYLRFYFSPRINFIPFFEKDRGILSEIQIFRNILKNGVVCNLSGSTMCVCIVRIEVFNFHQVAIYISWKERGRRVSRFTKGI